MAVFNTNWATVSPTYNDAWTDIDLSGSLPAGTTGAMFYVYSSVSDALEREFGLRKNGSTDDRKTEGVPDQWGLFFLIGCDTSRIFEGYFRSSDSAAIKVRLIGYFMSDATFLTNGVDVSLGSTGSWVEIDLGGTVPAGKDAVFIEIYPTTNIDYGLRMNGSTDNRLANCYIHQGAIVGCDASRIIEGQVASVNCDFFLVGYLDGPAAFNTNAVDKSTAVTGSYEDVDESATAPVGTTGVVVEEYSSGGAGYQVSLRKNGSTDAAYYYYSTHNHGFVGVDGSMIFEQQISHANKDIFVHGYMGPEPTPAGKPYYAYAQQ